MTDVRFAQSGDVHIAYRVVGDGPIDLVYVQGTFTHLDVYWELPAYRRYCERLAEFTRLVLFDKRGMGMSDRVPGAATLEQRMDDVRAIMDSTGSERAAIMGGSEGAALAMLFAAAHPRRTSALILVGPLAKQRRDEEWPWGTRTEQELEELVREFPERWGSGFWWQNFAPSVADQARVDEFGGRLQIHSATPGSAAEWMRMTLDIDVRPVAPAIRVPTLILHRTGDRTCHVENGRFLAREIPDATYVELPGEDHSPWTTPDDLLAEIREFLTGTRESARVDRALATVLFTDLVRSTEQAVTLGDSRWRDLLEQHHAVVRRELGRFDGVERDTAGDGFFATFDGPARAIRCAQAIVGGVAALGLEMRAGLHTGEVELLDDKVTGIAVNIGARVTGHAAPGEVLVSSTVKDLVAGSGLVFEDRGAAQLKGIPGEWRLFAVEA
jgi:pimeloyl-ACP methyl ester carboxylesterase